VAHPQGRSEVNERIRELAEQAGLRFTQLMSNPMVPIVDGKETDLEKFAELIVRECVTAMYKRGEAYAHPSAGFYQAKEFSETIMKHFGVEK